METLDFRNGMAGTVQKFTGMYKDFGFQPGEMNCEIQNGVLPVHFFFDGKTMLIGKSTWEACQYNIVTGVDPETGYLLFGIIDSYFTITAENGDKFTGIYDGEGELREDNNIYFWGTFHITPEDNTGMFECVTGDLLYDGQTHPDGSFFKVKGYLDFTNTGC